MLNSPLLDWGEGGVNEMLLDSLDERLLIPGEHPVLTHADRGDGVVEIRYLDRYYAAPVEDVLIMPMNNTSSENLATWIGREVRRLLQAQFGQVETRRLRVAVEETSGQRGVYRYSDS